MNRKRHLMCLAIVVAFVVYMAAYAWFRNCHELVHVKSWAGRNNMHHVEAVLPDGRLFFIGVLLASADETNGVDHASFSNTLAAAGSSIERRRDTLQFVFAPLRWSESLAWEIVDGRNKNQ